jgi:hypothetical protein
MMRRLLRALVLLLAPFAAAATNDNDDSCDIALLPAATLLLPYFEVDLDDPHAENTRFSVTNVTNLDRVAHVTLWTDRAVPVVELNVFLTGYDMQTIDLRELLTRGAFNEAKATGLSVTKRKAPVSDPNIALDLTACAHVPASLDGAALERVRRAFTEGIVDGCAAAGGRHELAAGYVTIDVVGSCTATGVTDPVYWTRDLRYDNVLIGEYELGGDAVPMVHVRAVPEGGTPESRRRAIAFDAGFERTFYARYQPADAPRLDGRQPLPAQFAARWLQSGGFSTRLTIWRETGGSGCADALLAAATDATDVVVFDENENAAGLRTLTHPSVLLPAASVTALDDAELYPPPPNGAAAGWIYLNLDAGTNARAASQNWVQSTMHGGPFSATIDAAALGNGCSAPARASTFTLAGGGTTIGPAPDNPRARRGTAATANDDSCDIALLPAATLLLPYFEVDVEHHTRTTLFTITNVAPREQIARVTLWTDYAYPVLTFNVDLTGYDVQSIDLYDVLARGALTGAESGTCRSAPLPPESVARVRNAFLEGSAEECDVVGNAHTYAIGYATVDVVGNCSADNPTSDAYWTYDAEFDNVLIGDYQQVHFNQPDAYGAPMVHIRAIPEAAFSRTFYGRWQPATNPRRDLRQPLPSTFAARWSFQPERYAAMFTIWREAIGRPTLACGQYDDNVREFREIVAFDEQENFVGDVPLSRVTPLTPELTLPATSVTSVRDASIFPQFPSGARSGWVYLNLSTRSHDHVGQSWVVATTRTHPNYPAATAADAIALGNGCSSPVLESEITVGTHTIGPAPNP